MGVGLYDADVTWRSFPCIRSVRTLDDHFRLSASIHDANTCVKGNEKLEIEVPSGVNMTSVQIEFSNVGSHTWSTNKILDDFLVEFIKDDKAVWEKPFVNNTFLGNRDWYWVMVTSQEHPNEYRSY